VGNFLAGWQKIGHVLAGQENSSWRGYDIMIHSADPLPFFLVTKTNDTFDYLDSDDAQQSMTTSKQRDNLPQY
jgi:hypothetical protein